MEAFSLLKYWRGSGGGVILNDSRTTPCTTTISTTVQHQPTVETDDDDDEVGSFFDLEFTVPDDDDGEVGVDQDSNSGVDEEYESSSSASARIDGERTDTNLSLSPSDDLFFKGSFMPLDSSEPNSKSQFPVSLLKSATKFRVLTLGFKKPKSKTETNVTDATSPNQKQKQKQKQENKLFTVKFKVEEVPIVSLFTRENSSRSFGNKLQKQNSDEATTDDKRFSKDVVQKYLKMIKPLYVRVSKMYGEKLKFSGQLSSGFGKTAPAPTMTTPVSSPKTNQGEAEESKQGNFSAGLRVVRKHLGKSRSASSAVAAVTTLPLQSSRRDDSLLQQREDGIQGAILHCKRSFNATRELETSVLSRCASDPSHEKWINSSRNSSDLSHKKAGSSSRISSEGVKFEERKQ